jgi:type III restriction enzyme
MLKDYQQRVVKDIQTFFSDLDGARQAFEITPALQTLGSYVALALSGQKYVQFPDKPMTGKGVLYPRVCIKMPTGGGKTLVAIETIRSYQNLFAKRKTGLVVWITHRETIYRQTIENLQNKNHPYRQFLDQASGNRTLVLEKGQLLRRQDVEENLVILMLMIQSAARESNKLFADSGYTDFFPLENRYDLHKEMLARIPNLDKTEDTLFDRMQIKTSLGNVIRTLSPLIIVDEFHTMFTDNAVDVLNGLNPSIIIGLSATPKRGMNIISSVSGKDLEKEDMIKLDMHLIAPSSNGDWRSMLSGIKSKRDDLEKKARKLELNEGVYIRPIALIQAERTGRDQRGQGFVHSEDVREFLIASDVPAHQIAVKSSSLDEIRAQKLLSKESEIRYIITKEALKEGWDCSFAYILGVIPNARNSSSMTQLVGRVLRQPYAKKTGVPDLDESYVFFASGNTQEVLDHVKGGFDDEGLGDIKTGIEVRDHRGQVITQTRVVRIKKDILKKYADSLFLPVWLVKDGTKYRRFSYDIDVKPQLDWKLIDLTTWLKEIAPTIGKRSHSQTEVIIDLEGQTEREMLINETVSFDTLYLTRRLSETTDNAFVAYDIAKKAVAELGKTVKKELLDQDAGYIARELEKRLVAHRRAQEQQVFDRLVGTKKLVLAVSDDQSIGFTMPDTDVVENGIQSSYKLNLYEDVDASSLNSLEHSVVSIVERSPNVLWWTRNKARGRGWYSVQGWQRNKIWPDFVIARKNEKDELEFVYIVESKGEQLLGNADTEYKTEVFEAVNSMKGKVEKIKLRTTTVKLNDRFEFELIPQNEEEMRLRAKLDV